MNYREHVPLAGFGFNTGLHTPTPQWMELHLGWPRPEGSMGTICRPVTNPVLRAKLVTRDVGPFSVTGHIKAVQSLERIFAKVKAEHPDLYPLIGTAGMLCCRFIRG